MWFNNRKELESILVPRATRFSLTRISWYLESRFFLSAVAQVVVLIFRCPFSLIFVLMYW